MRMVERMQTLMERRKTSKGRISAIEYMGLSTSTSVLWLHICGRKFMNFSQLVFDGVIDETKGWYYG